MPASTANEAHSPKLGGPTVKQRRHQGPQGRGFNEAQPWGWEGTTFWLLLNALISGRLQ